MWRKFKHPIQTQVGYRTAEELHIDVLLLPRDSLNSEYRVFTASVKPKACLNVLLHKTQAQALNIGLTNVESRTYQDGNVTKKVLWVLERLDCILPVAKLSDPCAIYKYEDAVQGIEIMEGEDDQPFQDPQHIVVGFRFLDQLEIWMQMKEPPLSRRLLKTVEPSELNIWDRNLEGLGLFKALKLQGKNLLIGQDLSGEDQTEAMKRKSGMEIETQKLMGYIKRISEELEKDISKEEVKKLTKLLLSLLSQETLLTDKQVLMTTTFPEFGN